MRHDSGQGERKKTNRKKVAGRTEAHSITTHTLLYVRSNVSTRVLRKETLVGFESKFSRETDPIAWAKTESERKGQESPCLLASIRWDDDARAVPQRRTPRYEAVPRYNCAILIFRYYAPDATAICWRTASRCMFVSAHSQHYAASRNENHFCCIGALRCRCDDAMMR